MTNREWLESLSDEMLASEIDGLCIVGQRWTKVVSRND